MKTEVAKDIFPSTKMKNEVRRAVLDSQERFINTEFVCRVCGKENCETVNIDYNCKRVLEPLETGTFRIKCSFCNEFSIFDCKQLLEKLTDSEREKIMSNFMLNLMFTVSLTDIASCFSFSSYSDH